MSTMITPAVGTYAAKAVAQCVGLDVAALRVLGVPDGAELTRDDLAALLAELRRRGYPARAHSLEVFMRQARETPSRALISPAPKSAQAFRPAWMDRADLR
jgi:hypothetical protein